MVTEHRFTAKTEPYTYDDLCDIPNLGAKTVASSMTTCPFCNRSYYHVDQYIRQVYTYGGLAEDGRIVVTEESGWDCAVCKGHAVYALEADLRVEATYHGGDREAQEALCNRLAYGYWRTEFKVMLKGG